MSSNCYAQTGPCQSESCNSQVDSNQVPTPTIGVNCGNGICDEAETSATCNQDCHCGDGVCSSDFFENTSNCEEDCGVEIYCGDGVCSDGERGFCPEDCWYQPTPTPTPTPTPSLCGNLLCDEGETVETCPGDCDICQVCVSYGNCPVSCTCGNGSCDLEQGETTYNCPSDCVEIVTTTTTTTIVTTTTSTTIPAPVCPEDRPNLYPTNNLTYNNLGWGGKCRKCPETAPWEYNGTCNNCPQSDPFAYPTNNPTYNNLGWGGKCRKCPETAPWEYNGTCNVCPESEPFVVGNNVCRQCPGGQIFRDSIGKCAEPCKLFKASFDVTRDNDIQVAKKLFTRNEKLSCIDKILNDAELHTKNFSDRYRNLRFFDSILASKIFGNESCLERMQYPQATPSCTKAVSYFDENCNILPANVVENECGDLSGNVKFNYYIYGSPISLIWEDKAKVGESISFVNFSINPAVTNKVWVWKASKELPLLVYDPAHQGKVTSATQLFGNWTFGGQKLASLAINDDLARPWNNGYDALATLDSNFDGVINGDELAPLALWFDENQDAVSQNGEVKPVSEVGLRELYYKAAVENKITNDIELAVGFKRYDGRREVRGASVDWFSEFATNPAELYMKYLNTSVMKGVVRSKEINSQQVLPTESELQKPIESMSADGYTGVWEWSFEETNSESRNRVGILLIKQDENGSISGKSLIESPVTESNKLKSTVLSSYLEGKIDGQNNLVFQLISADGKVESTAKFAEGQDVIRGTSTFVSKDDNKKVTYSWTAKRR